MVHNIDLQCNTLIIDSIYYRFYINNNESRDELVDAGIAYVFYEDVQSIITILNPIIFKELNRLYIF